MKHLKTWSSWETTIVKIYLTLMVSSGIFLCGWICGKISTDTLLDTYEKIEYVYIEEPCTREHVEEVAEEVPQNASIEPVEALESPKLYTDEDAVALAKTLYGEARGVGNNGVVSGTCQKAAVVWCVLNRYDAGYADSILEVCAAKGQFHGYRESHPVWDELLELSYDVLDRWNAEKNGETDVGRVLPADYYWFAGDGKFNHFRNVYRTSARWDWSLEDPYSS